jgi:hypothetical protein
MTTSLTRASCTRLMLYHKAASYRVESQRSWLDSCVCCRESRVCWLSVAEARLSLHQLSHTLLCCLPASPLSATRSALQRWPLIEVCVVGCAVLRSTYSLLLPFRALDAGQATSPPDACSSLLAPLYTDLLRGSCGRRRRVVLFVHRTLCETNVYWVVCSFNVTLCIPNVVYHILSVSERLRFFEKLNS